MSVKHLKNCKEFVAGDGSLLRELLHLGKGDFQIGYSLAHAAVGIGKSTKPHRLKSTEVYYILAGKGSMYIDSEFFDVSEDCTVYIRPGALQYIENTGDCELKFLCIVQPAWKQEDEEIID